MNNPEVEILELPRFRLDLLQSTLTDAAGRTVPLRPQSAAVLQLLGRHANQVVSKETLMHEIWGATVVTDDSLVQCIKEIRRALGDSAHHIIQTLPKHGYKLVVPARPAAPSVQPLNLSDATPLGTDEPRPERRRSERRRSTLRPGMGLLGLAFGLLLALLATGFLLGH